MTTHEDIAKTILNTAEFYSNWTVSSYIEQLLTLDIGDFCAALPHNYNNMLRLMNININQHRWLIAARGMGAAINGDSTIVTPDRQTPSYAQERDYITNFQSDIQAQEVLGEVSTRKAGKKYGTANWGVNDSNDYMHLYPDFQGDNMENDVVGDIGPWSGVEEQPQSILNTTKRLFEEKKIHTIISAFHTDNDSRVGYNGSARTREYGESHGRNLLKKSAEYEGDVGQLVNGYDNPYCRVWTNHHRYDKYRKLIRPFNGDTVNTVSQLHNWGDNFGDEERDANGNVINGNVNERIVNSETYKKQIKWKSGEASKWRDLSVLNNKNGMLNIAPQYLGGGNFNIHTKSCMLSIENLAWQGYNPYEFEKALSWEQRGPFGGRIMWFPPYGLKFNEDTSVNWNEHQFIGRGESVYTYTNTQRTGQLSFMMVIDHPSIIDYALWDKKSKENLRDTDLLRFFAGCEDVGDPNGDGVHSIKGNVKPTPLTDEYDNVIEQSVTMEEVVVGTPDKKNEDKENENITPSEELEFVFYVFFPNNYSGYYDKPGSEVEAMAYLLAGTGAQTTYDPNNHGAASKNRPIKFNELTINYWNKDTLENEGSGYEMFYSKSNVQKQEFDNNYIVGNSFLWGQSKSKTYSPTLAKKWFYRIDGEYKVPSNKEDYARNTYDQTLSGLNTRYQDTKSNHLNYDYKAIKQFLPEEKSEYLFSFAEVAYAFAFANNQKNVITAIIQNTGGNEYQIPKPNIRTPDTDKNVLKLLKAIIGDKSKYGDFKDYLSNLKEDDDVEYKIVSISCQGMSNSHGYNPKKGVNVSRNTHLANERANSVKAWFKTCYGKDISDVTGGGENIVGKQVTASDEKNESGDSAKAYRHARCVIKVKRSNVAEVLKSTNPIQTEYMTNDNLKPVPVNSEQNNGNTEQQGETEQSKSKYPTYKDFQFSREENGHLYYKCTVAQPILNSNGEPKKDANGKIVTRLDSEEWERVIENGVVKMRRAHLAARHSMDKYDNNPNNGYNKEESHDEYNRMRYDQEYYFFKQLERDRFDVFMKLKERLGYFIPAYHSMTPEGFMGRLTFLHQCTRQGNTVTSSDKNGVMANNLAFGRPPFCILRLGDFYYQKIVIRNISIDYDPLVLDLNDEGIGVVPLIANVNISFNFIGGGDLTGPVRRLQNAMSFNYYANTRLYDNRADRIEYKDSGPYEDKYLRESYMDTDKSYFHNVPVNGQS